MVVPGGAPPPGFPLKAPLQVAGEWLELARWSLKASAWLDRTAGCSSEDRWNLGPDLQHCGAALFGALLHVWRVAFLNALVDASLFWCAKGIGLGRHQPRSVLLCANLAFKWSEVRKPPASGAA